MEFGQKMSKPLINEYDVSCTLPPPTYNEATSNEAAKKGSPYSVQEGIPVRLEPPVLLGGPIPMRVAGDTVFVENQSGRSESILDDPTFGPSFGNKAIRATFVRKVYFTLMLQLLTTVVFIVWFMFHEETRKFVLRRPLMLIIAYVIFLVTYITLVCCSSVRRTWPCNIIMLSIFTLSMSYWCATISAFHDTYIVFMAIGIVVIVCLGITAFSIQTKWDITGAGIYLFVFLMVVVLFGLLAMVVALTTGSRIMSVVYAGLLGLVFSMYLVYDTQQIIGGRKIELSAEEHIYGALQLYIDVINLYLVILSLSSNSCK